jgi:hypothetical protein
VTFDNPFRITDSPNPVGTFDGGPATGRIALYPSNTYQELNTTFVVKRLVWDSTLSGFFSAGFMRQNERLIPFSTNTADILTENGSPPFNATCLCGLPRQSAEAAMNTQTLQLRWSADPTAHWRLNTEYRFFKLENNEPRFVITEFVREDADIRATDTPGGTYSSLPLAYDRHTATIEANYDFRGNSRLGLTYSFERMDRSFREVARMNDNHVKVSYDTRIFNWLNLKTFYEHTIRDTARYKTNQWDVSQGDPAFTPQFLFLRKFDEAPFHKDDAQIMATVSLSGSMSISSHALYGHTNYADQTFGLLGDTHYVVAGDYSYAASDRLSFFADYSYEHYDSHLRGRTFVPGGIGDPYSTEPGLASFSNWEGFPSDNIQTAGLGLDWYLVPNKLHLNIAYPLSRSRGRQTYTSPLGTPANDNNAFVPAPFNEVDNVTYHTLNPELEYKLSRRFALTAAYDLEIWHIGDFNYEGFQNVNNFQVINFLPMRGASVLMGGLLPPPYSANVFYLRLKVGL